MPAVINGIRDTAESLYQQENSCTLCSSKRLYNFFLLFASWTLLGLILGFMFSWCVLLLFIGQIYRFAAEILDRL